MNNPNEYPSGTLSADKLNMVVFNSETGQHEWQTLEPVVTTKKKAAKDAEVATKP
jgi:hypothetical protein